MIYAKSFKPGLKHADHNNKPTGTEAANQPLKAPAPDPSPVQADARQNTEPLTDGQIARYHARMESGYYDADEIRRRVAERICEKEILKEPSR